MFIKFFFGVPRITYLLLLIYRTFFIEVGLGIFFNYHPFYYATGVNYLEGYSSSHFGFINYRHNLFYKRRIFRFTSWFCGEFFTRAVSRRIYTAIAWGTFLCFILPVVMVTRTSRAYFSASWCCKNVKV